MDPTRSDAVEERLDLIDEVLGAAFAFEADPSQENEEDMIFLHSQALDQRVADLEND